MSENSLSSEAQLDRDFVPFTGKMKPRCLRPSKAGIRKIHHDWKDAAAVEKRPVLWDAGSSKFKMISKGSWRYVAEEIGIEGVDANEVKTEWLALRSTFFSRLRKTKSAQGADESHTVIWPLFT